MQYLSKCTVQFSSCFMSHVSWIPATYIKFCSIESAAWWQQYIHPKTGRRCVAVSMVIFQQVLCYIFKYCNNVENQNLFSKRQRRCCSQIQTWTSHPMVTIQELSEMLVHSLFYSLKFFDLPSFRVMTFCVKYRHSEVLPVLNLYTIMILWLNLN